MSRRQKRIKKTTKSKNKSRSRKIINKDQKKIKKSQDVKK